MTSLLSSVANLIIGVPGVSDTVSLAETISKGGAVLILVLACLALIYAYRDERKKNDKLNSQILDNSKEMLVALNSVATAMSGFKDLLFTLRISYPPNNRSDGR